MLDRRPSSFHIIGRQFCVRPGNNNDAVFSGIVDKDGSSAGWLVFGTLYERRVEALRFLSDDGVIPIGGATDTSNQGNLCSESRCSLRLIGALTTPTLME